MFSNRFVVRLLATMALVCCLLLPQGSPAQDKATGEVQFTADTNAERDSGVWIDGRYVGYVRELKGDKKVLLAPGQHEVSVRQAGYVTFTKTIVVKAGGVQVVAVTMEPDSKAQLPGDNAATVKVNVKPTRAAVFVDDGYVGHGGDLGGRFHSLLVAPGKHHVKIELPGYRTYETDINVVAGQKSEIRTELVKGSTP